MKSGMLLSIIRNLPQVFLVGFVLLGLVSFPACSFKKDNLKKEKIRIGINAWPGYEYLYLAHQKGYFKDEGLDTEIVEFHSLADTRRAFEKGLVNVIGATSIEVTFIAHLSDEKPVIVYVADESMGADVVIGGVSANSIKDLKGKKIGVEMGSLTIYLTYLALKAEGLQLSDVQLIPIDQTNAIQMLQAKKIDAVVTYPPNSVELLKNKNYHVLYSSRKAPGKIIDFIVMNKNLEDQYRGISKKIQKAFDKAVAYSLEFPGDAYTLMAKREGIAADEFKEIVNNDIKVFQLKDQSHFEESNLKSQLAEVEKILFETKQLMGTSKLDRVSISTHRE